MASVPGLMLYYPPRKRGSAVRSSATPCSGRSAGQMARGWPGALVAFPAAAVVRADSLPSWHIPTGGTELLDGGRKTRLKWNGVPFPSRSETPCALARRPSTRLDRGPRWVRRLSDQAPRQIGFGNFQLSGPAVASYGGHREEAFSSCALTPGVVWTSMTSL